MNPDDVIFGSFSSQEDPLGEDTWSAVIAHVIGQLSRTFEHDLRLVEDDSIRSSDGFSVDFRSEDVGSSLWQLRLRGVIGTDIIRGSLLVRAWVFMYLNDDRLPVGGQDHVLWMTYVKTAQGGVWQSDGWQLDEYGEWGWFERFDRE